MRLEDAETSLRAAERHLLEAQELVAAARRIEDFDFGMDVPIQLGTARKGIRQMRGHVLAAIRDLADEPDEYFA